MTPCRKLNSPESDGALQRHLDGRLLHTIFTIWTGSPGDCAAAEVSLYWGVEKEMVLQAASATDRSPALITDDGPNFLGLLGIAFLSCS